MKMNHGCKFNVHTVNKKYGQKLSSNVFSLEIFSGDEFSQKGEDQFQ